MLGTVLSTLCVCTHLILTKAVWSRYYCASHFTAEETKTERLDKFPKVPQFVLDDTKMSFYTLFV